MAEMTDKQKRFVEEYLVDLNATQAAIRAGYSRNTADVIGSENLGKPNIQGAISAAMAERSERTKISQDRVIQEIARLGFSDLRKAFTPGGGILPVDEWDDDTAAAIAGIEVVTVHRGEEDEDGNKVPERVHKIKVWDKNAALEKLARHLGIYAPDRVDLGGKIETKETGEGSTKLVAALEAIAERRRASGGPDAE